MQGEGGLWNRREQGRGGKRVGKRTRRICSLIKLFVKVKVCEHFPSPLVMKEPPWSTYFTCLVSYTICIIKGDDHNPPYL